MATKKTVYKVKWKNLTIAAFSLFLLLTFLVFGFHLLNDYNATKKMIERINNEIEVKAIVDDEFTKTIKPDSTLSKFDAYWNYIKLGLIEVDMANLKKINTDIVGYIEVKGTDYSYPIVKSDNVFYKTHSLDRSKNSLGWLYFDEDASLDELDTNTIVFGNKNYFNLLQSSLKKVLKDEWKEDDSNFLIKLYTNTHSTLWQIISVYETKDEEHLKTDFQNAEEIQTYIDSMLKKTEIKFKGYAKTDDKILTLTTNSKGTNLVIQAKLIKIRTEE